MQKYIYIILVTFSVFAVTTAEKLIQAQILFRHGARNQIYKNLDWKNYEEVMEYLTPVGMRQHYVLGQWLRERYINQEKLLNEALDQNEIRIRSTDVNRTIMSALSNLYGMYPLGTGPYLPPNVSEDLFLPPVPGVKKPENLQNKSTPELFQPVPIHIVPNENDYVLRAYDSIACPQNQQYQHQNLQRENYKISEQKATDLKKRLGREMYWNQSYAENLTLADLANIQDTLIVHKWNGYTQYNLSNQTQDEMQEIYMLQINSVLFGDWEQVRTLSTPFFTEITQNMDDKLSPTVKSYKFYVYSAHDTTVLLMLNALNLTSTECLSRQYIKDDLQLGEICIDEYPGFASNLIFELYEADDKTNYVRVLYNGDPVKACPKSREDLSCSYEEFTTTLLGQLADYPTYCGIQMNVKEESEIPTWIWGLFFFAVIIAVLSLIFACYFYQKWQKVKQSYTLDEERRLYVQ